MLRLRMVEGIKQNFRSLQFTENITRKMLENKDFLEECLEKNFAFLKHVPNSVQYWHARKKDLFAMIRQLGKPTLFMTLSASELRWDELIKLLNTLAKKFDISQLISEDPVTCCIYFKRLVDKIMAILCSNKSYNPFGKYRVKDYFLRFEFQNRGSPHVHIILWLENDPKEPIFEDQDYGFNFVLNIG